ncbi:MAG TPA: hypothetical protein VFS08_20095 [Gemmatimonadaceae bacterium]|nr:hypothetical protein [Gemmatimonadaceae bacterium]
MSAQLRALRQLLVERFPDAAPLADGDARRIAPPVGTGLATLDQVFPGGGLPRGKLTVWTPQGGATAVLRAACQAAVAAGERAAWIDAAHTAGPAWSEGPLLIRPEGRPRGEARDAPDDPRRDDPLRRLNALRSTEVLLRSGGFALVVLAGAPPQGTETVRLVRAAREGGSALVVLTTGASLASLRVTSRLLPHGYRWAHGPFADPAAPLEATVQVRVRTLGWNRQAEVVLPVTPYELRLSLDPGLADRRGGDRRGDRHDGGRHGRDR